MEFKLEAQRQGNGVEMIATNVTLGQRKTALERMRKQLAALRQRNEQRDPLEKTQLIDMIEHLRGEVEILPELIKQAARFKTETRISGQVSNAATAAQSITATGKKGKSGLSLDLSFGQRTARFVIADGTFAKK